MVLLACLASSCRGLSSSAVPQGSLKSRLPPEYIEGLDIRTIPSSDGHPLTLYSLSSRPPSPASAPLLLLHGRTWSSLPVYNLTPSLSTIKSFPATVTPYMMDFRGFGLTKPDSSMCVTPEKCAMDVKAALDWIREYHMRELNVQQQEELGGSEGGDCDPCKPSLLGWSQGALVAHLTAQKYPSHLNKLVLFGSLYDKSKVYPRSPIFQPNNGDGHSRNLIHRNNTVEETLSDFTVEDSISLEVAMKFSKVCMKTDPVKCLWTNLHEFNDLRPAKLTSPTLIIGGRHDPYSPENKVIDLFVGIEGGDKSWVCLGGSDHASHLLEGVKERWMKAVCGFLEFGEQCSISG